MTILGRGLRVVVGFSIFASALGCKQILDLEDRTLFEATADGGSDATAPPPMPVVGECGMLRHPSGSCAACMDTNCCAEATACRGDLACEPSFDCLTSCGNDGACRAQCALFFTQPAPLVGINGCRERNCSAECGLSCGGLGYRVPGCDQCVRSTCCSAAEACARNEACVKLDACLTGCLAGSTTCPPQCAQQYPDGVADQAVWSDCTRNACREACQPGPIWSCVGSTRWPQPKSGVSQITFSLTVLDIITGLPFAGSRVKACGKLDPNCNTPLDDQTTDVSGLVSLTVGIGSTGFDGYLDITGGASGGAPIYPTLWYPLPAIVASGNRGTVQVVSQSNFEFLARDITKVSPDPTRGHFAANAQDCTLTSVGGVAFTADKADSTTRTYYFVSGIPNASATETDSQTGIGGFVNLEARLTLITAMSVADGKKVGEHNFFIRAGSMTISSMPPK